MKLFPAPTWNQFWSAARKDMGRRQTWPFVVGFGSSLALFLPLTLGATDADKENSAFYKHINRHEFRKGGKFAPTWPAPAKKGGDADDDDDDLIPEIF